MILKEFSPDISSYPSEIQPMLKNAKLFDSSCSPEAKVIFIDKDNGYFLKSSHKGSLEREALLTKYFNSKGLATNVLLYKSDDQDWLLTEKINGNDCIYEKHLEQPKKLCDLIAMQLSSLHNEDFSGCPINNHTELYIAKAKQNYRTGNFDKTLFPDSWGYATPEEAYKAMETCGCKLETNTLLHGDYCLPNIIMDDWKFSGFIDLDNGGVGDRHVDLFWALWTLEFNLKTDKYRERFIDVYGRSKVDEERLQIVAAVEVFE